MVAAGAIWSITVHHCEMDLVARVKARLREFQLKNHPDKHPRDTAEQRKRRTDMYIAEEARLKQDLAEATQAAKKPHPPPRQAPAVPERCLITGCRETGIIYGMCLQHAMPSFSADDNTMRRCAAPMCNTLLKPGPPGASKGCMAHRARHPCTVPDCECEAMTPGNVCVYHCPRQGLTNRARYMDNGTVDTTAVYACMPPEMQRNYATCRRPDCNRSAATNHAYCDQHGGVDAQLFEIHVSNGDVLRYLVDAEHMSAWKTDQRTGFATLLAKVYPTDPTVVGHVTSHATRYTP